ncbi:hypothetical protein AAKU67_004212 [Oxalobacteraceae bacterium GrIS 2.11]
MTYERAFYSISKYLYFGALIDMVMLAFRFDRFSSVFVWLILPPTILVVVIGIYDSTIKHSRFGVNLKLTEKMPKWLIFFVVCTFFVLLIQIPSLSVDLKATFEIGYSYAGETVHQRHWYESGGKYFMEINKKHVYEITSEEYDQLMFGLKRLFGILSVIASCISVAIWNHLMRYKNELLLKKYLT